MFTLTPEMDKNPIYCKLNCFYNHKIYLSSQKYISSSVTCVGGGNTELYLLNNSVILKNYITVNITAFLYTEFLKSGRKKIIYGIFKLSRIHDSIISVENRFRYTGLVMIYSDNEAADSSPTCPQEEPCCWFSPTAFLIAALLLSPSPLPTPPSIINPCCRSPPCNLLPWRSPAQGEILQSETSGGTG